MTEKDSLSPEPHVSERVAGAAAEPPAMQRVTVSRGWRIDVSGLLNRYAAVFILLGLILFFSILLPDTFPTLANATAVLNTQAITLILALGTMVPLITGEFDLSVGFVLGFGALLVAKLTSMGWNPLLAVAVTLLACLAVGIVNGVLVVRFRINAFIATLGVGTVLSGITVWVAGGTQISGLPQSFIDFGRTQLKGFETPVFFMVGLIVVFHLVFTKTPTGRYMYAIGGGREAARLAGIATGPLRLFAFALCSTTAGLAGILQTSITGSASPDFGPSFLLPAFAACFLGATAIRPGRFNALGTAVALLLLAVGIDGLQLLGAPFWVGPIFNGGALLVAVGLSVSRSVRQATD